MVSAATTTTSGGTQLVVHEAGLVPVSVTMEQQSTHGIPNNVDRDYSSGEPSLVDIQDRSRLLTASYGQLPGIWETDVANELLVRLENLRRSGDRYVYPGGMRPVEAAFADARLFLESLAPLRITPKISLVSDGEINFAWDGEGIYVDLGFYGDGEGGSYYAEDSSGNRYHCDSFAPEQLPHDVARLVCK